MTDEQRTLSGRVRTAAGGAAMTDEDYARNWFARLMSKVKINANGCWIWQGYIPRSRGYGQTTIRSEGNTSTHRAVWIMKHGPIRPDQYVCHKCDVMACCNPDHLWLGDALTNQQDKNEKRRNFFSSKTHCKRGHEFTPENTQWRKPYRDRGPSRECKTCAAARHKRDFRKEALPLKNPIQARYQKRYREKLKARGQHESSVL